MKQLYLLRHAKAVPAEDGGDDFARELSGRGHADAARLGAWLAERGLRPDVALCSPSRRTVETWQDVSQAFDKPPKVEFRAPLYLATAAVLMAEIRKAPARAACVMVIAHNPGLENLALRLAAHPVSEKEKQRQRKLADGLSTCAFAAFAFAFSAWKDVVEGQGKLQILVRPKELKD